VVRQPISTLSGQLPSQPAAGEWGDDEGTEARRRSEGAHGRVAPRLPDTPVTPVVAPGVTAVIVNYNAAAHLRVCLQSMRSNGVAHVVVVDNGSDDDSDQVVRSAGARWMPMGANLGYGRAVNRGAATPEARAATCLLVCNPDIDLTQGAVSALLASLSAQPDLGVVGPRLSNPDGTVYPSARTFPDLGEAIGHGLLGTVAPGNRFTRRYRMLDWDHRQPERVDWVSGACFLVRRAAWDMVGGFDPVYFMYMEDVDLCWRLSRLGWGVGYQPGAEVVHVQGASTNRHPYRMLAAHHLSMWKFARRTNVGCDRRFLPLVAVGLAFRLVVVAVRHGLGRDPAPSRISGRVDP
jgi:N-acetylglucosaminyl-diphospho-decaprenol L-rhamnosyltransferase